MLHKRFKSYSLFISLIAAIIPLTAKAEMLFIQCPTQEYSLQGEFYNKYSLAGSATITITYNVFKQGTFGVFNFSGKPSTTFLHTTSIGFGNFYDQNKGMSFSCDLADSKNNNPAQVGGSFLLSDYNLRGTFIGCENEPDNTLACEFVQYNKN